MKHRFLFVAAIFIFGRAQGEASEILTDANFTKEAFVSAMNPENRKTIRTRSIRVQSVESTASDESKEKTASAALDINFTSGSAILKPSSKRLLDQVAAIMNDDLKNFRFDIEGHTDSTGSKKVNMTLSERRAKSVAAYLSLQQNVDKERLQPIGKGSTRPLIPSNPMAPQNRRVTFVNRGEVSE